MNTRKFQIKAILAAVIVMTMSNPVFAQTLHPAELMFENNSNATMTVKIMAYTHMRFDKNLQRNLPDGKKYTTLVIPPYGTTHITINDAGTYFTKSKAERPGDTTYSQDEETFQVVVADGRKSFSYSVITISFSLSSISNPLSNTETIDRTIFDKD